MAKVSKVRKGDLIQLGSGPWRRVREVKRVPDPKAPTPRQRQAVIDSLRADGTPEEEIGQVLAKLDSPPRWVRLTVDGLDGRPVALPPIPPDWAMEVDRGDDEEGEAEDR